MRLLSAAVLGGAAGAALLLSIPAEGFENVAPVLLLASAVLIALPRRERVEGAPRSRSQVVVQGMAVLAICVYGGFFGAAAVVLMLALFLSIGGQTLAVAKATRNVLLGVANGVAALVFAVFAPVHWLAVVPLGIGCLIGSRLGPSIVRRAPATPLRLLVALGAVVLAIDLGLDTYR